jgi:GNAT superfamily N-acetyltransferase
VTDGHPPVIVTWLEMTSPEQHARARNDLPERARVSQAPPDKAPLLAKGLYCAVGESWHWTDRLAWSDQQWRDNLDRPDVQLWTLAVNGDIAGYFQLHDLAEATEIMYFGLLPHFTGQGLGGALLSVAIDTAWEHGRARVTLNTCTLDHPAALANYKARGFAVVRQAERVNPT